MQEYFEVHYASFSSSHPASYRQMYRVIIKLGLQHNLLAIKFYIICMNWICQIYMFESSRIFTFVLVQNGEGISSWHVKMKILIFPNVLFKEKANVKPDAFNRCLLQLICASIKLGTKILLPHSRNPPVDRNPYQSRKYRNTLFEGATNFRADAANIQFQPPLAPNEVPKESRGSFRDFL